MLAHKQKAKRISCAAQSDRLAGKADNNFTLFVEFFFCFFVSSKQMNKASRLRVCGIEESEQQEGCYKKVIKN